MFPIPSKIELLLSKQMASFWNFSNMFWREQLLFDELRIVAGLNEILR